MSDSVYAALKVFAQINTLPLVGSLYFLLSIFADVPSASAVLFGLLVEDLIVGLILMAAAKSYRKSQAKYDGVIDVFIPDDDHMRYAISLNSDPELLHERHEVLFKINPTEL